MPDATLRKATTVVCGGACTRATQAAAGSKDAVLPESAELTYVLGVVWSAWPW